MVVAEFRKLKTSKVTLSLELIDQSQKFYSQVFAEHTAAISSLHLGTLNTSSNELSGLMLSGSLDWTVRLWNPKTTKSLSVFDAHKDSVSDVHWNHAEAASFAMASVDGVVSVYNLLTDFENPICSFDYGECVLNSKWDPSGRMLGITDEKGGINIKRFNDDAFRRTEGDLENLEMILKYQAQGT